MSLRDQRANAEQFRALPEDGTTRELVSGVIVEREGASAAHEAALTRLHLMLSSFVEAGDLGVVFRHPWPVELSKLDVVRPDLYFVPWGVGAIEVDAVRGTPPLLAEVLSPESRERDLGEKLRLYAWAGVREYWVVDPGARTFAGKTKGQQGYDDLPADPMRFASELLPGLVIDLKALFEEDER